MQETWVQSLKGGFLTTEPARKSHWVFILSSWDPITTATLGLNCDLWNTSVAASGVVWWYLEWGSESGKMRSWEWGPDPTELVLLWEEKNHQKACTLSLCSAHCVGESHCHTRKQHPASIWGLFLLLLFSSSAGSSLRGTGFLCCGAQISLVAGHTQV